MPRFGLRARAGRLALVALALLPIACAHAGALPGGLTAAPGGRVSPASAVGRDLGPRAAAAPVRVSVALAWRHPRRLAALLRALADPRSGEYRRFLTPAQFVARFAPSARAQSKVLAVLRAAGLHVERTYPDRSLIDARAPSRQVARLFRTRIDDFAQPGYPTRYAAVGRIVVPRALAGIVRAVSIDDRVYAVASVRAPRNHVQNPGFEGGMAGWKWCGTAPVAIVRLHPHDGKFDARTGSRGSAQVTGWSAICQRVRIPPAARLSAWLWDVTNQRRMTDGFQAVGLMSRPGKVVALLYKGIVNRRAWRLARFDLARFSGRDLYLFFGVYGRGKPHLYATQFVDDVVLTGATPSPSPSPSSTPTASPTTTPTVSPTATPTASPTATPTPVGPGSGTPLAGPTFGPNGGWAARGVADGLDLPVQHGYDGRGTTVGVLTFSAPSAGDLAAALAYNGVTRGGTFAQVHVAGGPGSGDPTEATLDVETVESLVPGADVIAYELPNLDNQSIVDGFAAIVNAAKANVAIVPFGECDATDTGGLDAETEAYAQEAAAIGMTFVAAAGDDGSACYNGSNAATIGPFAPASDPDVTAAGGSDSEPSGALANPAVWNSSTGSSGVGAGGGGVSAYWPLPAYQTGVAGSPASLQFRNVPDLALPAVDADTFVGGTSENLSGTSWSASVLGALFAQAVEICGKLGSVNAAVYTAAAQSSVLTDVTQGTNALSGRSGYAAAVGYDDASGLGIPRGMAFAAALCGRTTGLLRRR